MMHAPRNEEVITALINALRPLWENNRHKEKSRRRSLKHTAILSKPDPWAAAAAVFRLIVDHRPFANFLIQGYRERARRYIANRRPDDRGDLLDVYRQVSVFWIYLRAQIHAARLFHAEWNGFESGSPEAPVRLTVGGAAVPLEEARRLARLAAKWSHGESIKIKEEAELHAFIESNNLRALALDQATALGFTSGQVAGETAATIEQLASLHDYLAHLDSWVAPFVDGFSKSKKTRSLTVVDIVHQKAGGKRREKFGANVSLKAQIEAIKEAEGSREADMVAATVRYGASTLTCLAYAVGEIYSSFISLTREGLIQKWGSGDETRGDKLIATAHREKSDAKFNLFAIYRCAITRDQSSISVETGSDHTDLETGDYLTNEGVADYDGTDFVIENRSGASTDGLDHVMGRGFSLVDKIASIEFALGPSQAASPFRNMADKAVAEASTIRRFEASENGPIGKAMTRSVNRFRKSFGS